MLKHDTVEQNLGILLILTTFVLSLGGLAEIVPLFFEKSTTTPVDGLKPYTPLQLLGRDVYIREGCNNCHSQMIRPFRAETERYGHYSVSGESSWDHPFLWGSKRTGPDLARVGGKYSNDWQYIHLDNPRAVVPESVMPAFYWLKQTPLNEEFLHRKMEVMKNFGVPYTDDDIKNSEASIEADCIKYYSKVGCTEADAVVAYLQNLGTALSSTR